MPKPSIKNGEESTKQRRQNNKIRDQEYFDSLNWEIKYSRCRYCGKPLNELEKLDWGMYMNTCEECFTRKTGIQISEVEFLVEVDKEGNTKILEVDGRKLEDKKTESTQ